MPDSSDITVPSLMGGETKKKMKKKTPAISVAEENKPLQKAISITPFELSFTGHPKNEALFWRSEDLEEEEDGVLETDTETITKQTEKDLYPVKPGSKQSDAQKNQDKDDEEDIQSNKKSTKEGNAMSKVMKKDGTLPPEAQKHMSDFMEKMGPHKDQFDPDAWNEMSEMAKSCDPTAIMKSLDGFEDPKVKALVANLAKAVDFITKDREEANQKLEKELADKETSRKATLKKSCDDFIADIAFIPVQKDELSNLIYEVSEKIGPEKAEVLKDILKKSHEAIKKGEKPTIVEGKETDINKTSLTKAEEFDAHLKEEIKKSDDKSAEGIRKAMSRMVKKYPDLYKAYEEAVNSRQIKPINKSIEGGLH